MGDRGTGLRGTHSLKQKDRGPEDPQTDRWEAGWVKEDGEPVMAGKAGQTRRSMEDVQEMMGV